MFVPVPDNFDYIRVSTTVSFDQADGLSQCVNISIVNDELAEADESFFVRLFNESSAIISTTTVVIRNNSKKYKLFCWIVILFSGIYSWWHSMYRRQCDSERWCQ